MKTITEVVMQKIEETRRKYFQEVGRHPGVKDKKLFINWYIENHDAPLDVLIKELSGYYLFISEETIIRYLNQPTDQESGK